MTTQEVQIILGELEEVKHDIEQSFDKAIERIKNIKVSYE